MQAARIFKMVVLLFAFLSQPQAAEHGGGGVYWYSAKVETSRLNFETTLRLETKILCATKAMHTDWSKLFAFEDETCRLSSLEVEADLNEEHIGPTTHVWTRIKTGEINKS